MADDRRIPANESAGAPARQMLDLLRRQAVLYHELAGLAKTQQALIAAEDTQPLLKILGQRQRLTIELQGLAERIRPLRGDWERSKGALDAAERQDADVLVRQTKELLGRLLAADEADAQLLRIRRQRTGEALRAVHANRQAVAAYGGAVVTTSGCLDRMHEDV